MESQRSRGETTTRPQPEKHCPEGLHTVTAHLVCAGAAEAIEFYRKAFNAQELARLPGPDGKIVHAMIRIGDSMVMLVDEFPEMGSFGPNSLKGSPVTIHLYVENVDAFVSRAVEAGAKITMPVQDMFRGDRYGQLEDPFGHHWSAATHIRDATPEELERRARERCGMRQFHQWFIHRQILRCGAISISVKVFRHFAFFLCNIGDNHQFLANRIFPFGLGTLSGS
jgi:PhnB protein